MVGLVRHVDDVVGESREETMIKKLNTALQTKASIEIVMSCLLKGSDSLTSLGTIMAARYPDIRLIAEVIDLHAGRSSLGLFLPS